MSNNYKENNLKNILHGFFLTVAMTVAEPSTILPLIVHHFSDSSLLVGLFVSLLRGGAILIQFFAAFYAQSFKYVMPYLKIVFASRVVSWFLIGVVILFIGDKNPTLTLILFGFFLFIFSFSAGFGSIYFFEIIGKIFDRTERGKSMANRQFFSAIGAIISGIIAGFILNNYSAPNNYAYLFIISSILMSFGMIAFSTIKEPLKDNISKREDSFKEFLINSFLILKTDKQLQLQILIILLSYSFFISLPFVVLEAKEKIDLTGYLIGGFITIQMLGAVLGNLLWKKLAPNYRLILIFSFLIVIISFLILYFFSTEISYLIFFFLIGFSIDGFKIAGMNLLLEIAKEEKRAVYTAIQNSITSLGLFFPILGGGIVGLIGYLNLYIITIFLLIIGLILSLKVKV